MATDSKVVSFTPIQLVWVRNSIELKRDQIRRAANQQPEGSRQRLAMLEDLKEVDAIQALFL